MTKEQRDKILKALAENRNEYARDCERRIIEEQSKIVGADYMIQRFLDILGTEVKLQENEKVEKEVNAVLDKILDEINEYKSRKILESEVADLEKGKVTALDYVITIIDKYKAEGEG